MNTCLPTHHHMMVIVKALIDDQGDEAFRANSPMQTCAKTQDILAMVLLCLGEMDIWTILKSLEVSPLKIDPETLQKVLQQTGHEDNIYKYFDEHYTPTHGKSSRIAYEEAEKTIAATSQMLAAAHRKSV